MSFRLLYSIAVLGLLTCCASPPARPESQEEPPVATFSIVAFDEATGDLGIAVQSRFLAVGAVVPWAKAGVGAIATQSFANTTFGPEGLKLLEEGKSPQEALDLLLEKDEGRDQRQVGIVNADGEAASFTGKGCMNWAGGNAGVHYCVQGNILAGEDVVKAMGEAFEKSEGDFGERLIGALQAGQDKGGDKRGMQSAALLVVRDKGGYGGYNDRFRDLRVDDHQKPIEELLRIYRLHQQVFRDRRGSEGRDR